VQYLYENDFNGGWTWFFGSQNVDEEDEDVLVGLRHLQGRTDHGVVDVEI